MTNITFKAIVPKAKLFDAIRMRTSVLSAARRTAELAKAALARPTVTWNTRPEFNIKIMGVVSGNFVVEISTEDQHYIWTNNGTEQHTIAPRNTRFLKYKSTFRSKTQIRSLYAGQGGYSGSWILRDEPIWHPGTAARQFDKLVAEIMEPVWQREVQAAINAAVR